MNSNIKETLKVIRFFDINRYLKWKFNQEPKTFKYELSIGIIVKNEAKYIQEWIEYHLLVGVNHFYVYDNESTDDLKIKLKPYIDAGIVEYIYFPGQHRQINMVNNVVKRAKNETKWLAIIDTDEFLVPLDGHKTITDALKEYKDAPGIEVNWVIYGDSGHEKETKGLVIERFKEHSLPDYKVNRNVKTICNPRKVLQASAHSEKYFGKLKSVNSANEINNEYFLDRKPVFKKFKNQSLFHQKF